MAISIVKIPESTGDLDFLAFSFKGKHSFDDFGIYRTSNGSRYDDNLMPTANELTAEVPGGDGNYYFGSFDRQKNFDISFAFDNLSEKKYREMKQWLNNKEMGELWFAESPYKIYMAKVTGQPNLKTLCFTKDSERIYKGEGSVQFVAYWPYAHTPDWIAYKNFKLSANTETKFNHSIKTQYFYIESETSVNNISFQFKKTGEADYTEEKTPNNKIIDLGSEIEIEAIKSSKKIDIILYTTNTSGAENKEPVYYWLDGKNADSYNGFGNKAEWIGASGLTNNTNLSQGENVGDLPSHFILRVSGQMASGTICVGSLSITTSDTYSDIEWNSKTGIVSANIDGVREPIAFTGNSLGSVPVEGISNWGLKQVSDGTTTYNNENMTLEYHYWYY